MKTLRLRLQVAELLGWSNLKNFSILNGDRITGLRGRAPDCAGNYRSTVPDWPTDLNACHKFELTLEDDPGRDAKYWETLYRLLDDDDEGNPIDGPPNGHWCDLKKVGHASAEQRCTAFVKTMEATSVPSASPALNASRVSSLSPASSQGSSEAGAD